MMRDVVATNSLTRQQLVVAIRARLPAMIGGDVHGPGEGVAIYTLSDPRDVRHTRYVGQSISCAAPRGGAPPHL